jgi:hypothetical protein
VTCNFDKRLRLLELIKVLLHAREDTEQGVIAEEIYDALGIAHRVVQNDSQQVFHKVSCLLAAHVVVGKRSIVGVI